MDIAPYGEAIAKGSELLNGILKRVLPEKMSEKERADIESALTLELLKADSSALLGQLGINQAEAQSEKLFVAGWRPFVGWVCGSAFAYSFVVQPFLAFMVGVFAWKLPPLPILDSSALMTVLLGMLGLAGARTVEKVKGVTGVKVGSK